MRDLGDVRGVGKTEEYHVPVLLREVIRGLNVRRGKKYIDATLGDGGHSFEILRLGEDVLGIDRDPEAIEYVERNWKLEVGSWKGRLTLVQGNFVHLKEIAIENGFNKVAGILFDLGVSTQQLLTDERGFSFNSDAELDMRMDPSLAVTAADLINGLHEKELYELFNKYGEEFHAWAVARAVVQQRRLKPIRTCRELAEIVGNVRGLRKVRGKLNPATRIFQALRICVNDELNNLKAALPQAIDLLERNGRLVMISFHSLEDRIVKNFFKEREAAGVLKILTEKVIRPGEKEMMINPGSRSAKMRIAEKL